MWSISKFQNTVSHINFEGELKTIQKNKYPWVLEVHIIKMCSFYQNQRQKKKNFKNIQYNQRTPPPADPSTAVFAVCTLYAVRINKGLQKCKQSGFIVYGSDNMKITLNGFILIFKVNFICDYSKKLMEKYN